ncbi:MAG: YbaB/EbfC family nucleoid-associated protein [Phycisphaeraceae bacterium]
MFDNLKNLGQLMKVAAAAKEKAAVMRKELEAARIIGESGGGAVRVTMDGKGKVLRLDIEQALFVGLCGDDKVMAEELIAAAMNDGQEKMQAMVMEKTRELTGGMDLPGLEN